MFLTFSRLLHSLAYALVFTILVYHVQSHTVGAYEKNCSKPKRAYKKHVYLYAVLISNNEPQPMSVCCCCCVHRVGPRSTLLHGSD